MFCWGFVGVFLVWWGFFVFVWFGGVFFVLVLFWLLFFSEDFVKIERKLQLPISITFAKGEICLQEKTPAHMRLCFYTAEHTEHKEKDLSSHISSHSLWGKEKVSNHPFSSLLSLFFKQLLRDQERNEFKPIHLEKLINTFTDFEVRNKPFKRNGVNLEILTIKKRTRGHMNSQQLL